MVRVKRVVVKKCFVCKVVLKVVVVFVNLMFEKVEVVLMKV